MKISFVRPFSSANRRIRYYLLGNGSNILFADEGFRGAVIDVSAEAAGMGLSIYQNADGDYISAPAGANFPSYCKFALQHGYTGLEFAYGIPGTVGGAVYMNAGAYGGEMKDVPEAVQPISPPTAAGWTVKRPSWTSPTGTARLKRMVPASLAQCSTWKKATRMPSRPGWLKLMQKRIDKQPLDKPSAGSTFKRPAGNAAALIDQCGLRGYRHGGAAVSDKHCGLW